MTSVIRRSVIEPPVFTDLAASGGLVRAPVTRVLSRHGRQVLAVAVGTLFAVGGAVLNVYGLSFATSRGTSAGSYLAMISVVTALGLVLQPLWARLSDRVGRRPVFIGSCLAAAVLYFAYLPALGSGNLLLVGLGAWTRSGFATMVDFLSPVYWFFLTLSGAALIVLRRRSLLGPLIVGADTLTAQANRGLEMLAARVRDDPDLRDALTGGLGVERSVLAQFVGDEVAGVRVHR